MGTAYRFTPVKRETFLALIRLGTRPIAAARMVGVDPKTAKNYARSNPEFAEDVELAHYEAAEPIEAKIYEAALAGEPWAIEKWTKAYNPAVWGVKPTELHVTGEISHSIEDLVPLDVILELQGRAFQRQDDLALGRGDDEIVDAEVIEDEVED